MQQEQSGNLKRCLCELLVTIRVETLFVTLSPLALQEGSPQARLAPLTLLLPRPTKVYPTKVYQTSHLLHNGL